MCINLCVYMLCVFARVRMHAQVRLPCVYVSDVDDVTEIIAAFVFG